MLLPFSVNDVHPFGTSGAITSNVSHAEKKSYCNYAHSVGSNINYIQIKVGFYVCITESLFGNRIILGHMLFSTQERRYSECLITSRLSISY